MRFVLCDVFSARPLAGNQLAVFTDAAGIAEDLLQPLAREINFSETVFVYPPTDPAATARIRIFVPTQEIPFAGHPVLGTAVVLGRERGLSELVLETGRAPVHVRLARSGGTMRQPLPPCDPTRRPSGRCGHSAPTARCTRSRPTTTACATSTCGWRRRRRWRRFAPT